MKKKLILFFACSTLISSTIISCKKDKEDTTEETTTPNSTTDTVTNSNTTTTDTSTNTPPTTSTKPTATTFKFAANGKDCGISDGFANQQHILPHLVHLNTDKCNGDTYRPTITLNFEQGQTITPGTYNLVAVGTTPGAGQFTITSAKYNYTDWNGTAGTVVVTQNASDSTKIDIELKSITMANQNPSDTVNPSTDVLTGFIIKI